MLPPQPAVTNILRYCLGLALSRHPEVRLHAYTASTNHTHAVATDAPGFSQLPDVLGLLHCLSGRALNCHFGEGENFWASGSYSNVEIALLHEDDADAFAAPDEQAPELAHDTLEEQLLYLWTNVVKDGLCASPAGWTGLQFLPEDFGKTITVHKPPGAFFGGRRPDDWEPTDPAARRRHRRACQR